MPQPVTDYLQLIVVRSEEKASMTKNHLEDKARTLEAMDGLVTVLCRLTERLQL